MLKFLNPPFSALDEPDGNGCQPHLHLSLLLEDTPHPNQDWVSGFFFGQRSTVPGVPASLVQNLSWSMASGVSRWGGDHIHHNNKNKFNI